GAQDRVPLCFGGRLSSEVQDGVDAVHELRDLLVVGEVGTTQHLLLLLVLRCAAVLDDVVVPRETAGQQQADVDGGARGEAAPGPAYGCHCGSRPMSAMSLSWVEASSATG